MRVSLYNNALTSDQHKDVSIVNVLRGIKGGHWAEKVNKVRAIEDKKKRDEAKKMLPAFTVSGVFNGRRDDQSLLEHSGLIAIDIDQDVSKWEALKNDAYTYAMFHSASGKGICVIVRIDDSSHAENFEALQTYYLKIHSITIDPTCRNVSRLRFISYDPDLYLNEASETFRVVVSEEFFMSDFERGVLAVESAGVDVTAGYNNWLRIGMALAAELGEGGRDFFHRISALSSQYDPEQCNRKFTDCLKARGECRAGTFFWILKENGIQLKVGSRKAIEYLIRQRRRNGSTAAAAATLAATTQGVSFEDAKRLADVIYAEKEKIIETFWFVKRDEEKDTTKLIFSDSRFTNWLQQNGFYRFKHEDEKEYRIVRQTANIIDEQHIGEVKKFVADFMAKLPFEFDGIFKIELEDLVQKNARRLFSMDLLEFLPDLQVEFLHDTKDQSFFCYKNGFVTVTKDGISLAPYTDLGGAIWRKRILPRHFELLTIEQLEEADGEFHRFCSNITADNPERFFALLSALGYLLHNWNNKANVKSIVLVDENLSDQASGGTGKGILVQAVEAMRKLERLDGQNLNLERSFAWQRITEQTQVVCLDDVDGRKLPFAKLFSILSEGMEVEKKNMGALYMPFAKKPKFIITTNQMVGGDNDSDMRRKHEIEIAPHYSTQHTPYDEFKHNLFDDWQVREWNLFDNFMLRAVQRFLIGGLMEHAPVNIRRRKLKQQTDVQFPAWMDEQLGKVDGKFTHLGKAFSRRVLYDDFLEDTGHDFRKFDTRKFAECLRKYAHYENLTIVERRGTTVESRGQQVLFFAK